MSKLLIGAIVTAAVTATVAGAKYLQSKFSYDSEGYNSDGFDRDGYDRTGYDKSGYDKTGYDKNGYNRNGYNLEGYNSSNVDISEHNRSYYNGRIKEMTDFLNEAHSQMKNNNLDFALNRIRIGMESGVVCIISHMLGEDYCDSRNILHNNIVICQENGLVSSDFASKLLSAKNWCNSG